MIEGMKASLFIRPLKVPGLIPLNPSGCMPRRPLSNLMDCSRLSSLLTLAAPRKRKPLLKLSLFLWFCRWVEPMFCRFRPRIRTQYQAKRASLLMAQGIAKASGTNVLQKKPTLLGKLRIFCTPVSVSTRLLCIRDVPTRFSRKYCLAKSAKPVAKLQKRVLNQPMDVLLTFQGKLTSLMGKTCSHAKSFTTSLSLLFSHLAT